jgi:putative oxidoreductase
MTSGPETWGATLLRLALGIVYLIHGWHALAVIGVPAVAGLVTGIGYPPSLATALAWYLVAAHVAGGALMLLGLWTRLAALLQVPIMASALFLMHFSQGFFMNVSTVETAGGPRPIVGGYEYSFLVLAATLALALTGPGRLSLEEWWACGPRVEIP